MEVLPQLSIKPGSPDEAKLDTKDRKILLSLGQDARAPFSKIAKAVGLSRDSVKYRIDGYGREGLMKGTVTVVDTSKLGYDAYHLFLRLTNPSKDTQKEIIEGISSLTHVRAVLRFFGSYDLEIAIIAKTPMEFDTLLTEILSRLGKAVQDYEMMIITNTYASGPLPKSFLKERKEASGFRLKEQQAYAPDNKDLMIIKRIRDDARVPLGEVADALDLSADAVGYRIRKMTESGIISFSPIINYKKLGYTVHALLLNMSLGKSAGARLANFMANNENILWAVKTVGRFNVLAYTCTRHDSELQDTIDGLRAEFPEEIRRYETLLAAEEYKYTYAPDCIFDDSLSP